MLGLALMLLLLLLMLAAGPADASPRRRCMHFPPYDIVNSRDQADKCSYGSVRDLCGYYRCAKGPGDICGGKGGRYGICGDGLICNNCNVCTGCSLMTFECYNGRTCI